ncbi:MAG: hypothetical protein HYY06_25650 [Deltaproteobacteria bacterium]|nr:hypothetical protein [Deltaproteobacteria bacterium]
MDPGAWAAYQLGGAGDFRAMRETLARLEARGSAEARAWCLTLRALSWHAGLDFGALPRIGEVSRLAQGPGEVRFAACLSCALAARASLLAFDPRALESWLDVHARSLGGAAIPAEATLWHEALGAWLRLMTGDLAGLGDAARALAASAADEKLAPLVVHSTALRAMAALAAGDMEAATSLARRASRMARTEALPQEEYLANVVLARLRRLQARPAMAARILGALLRVAPSSWHPWIAWELLLSAGPGAAGPTMGSRSPSEAAVAGLGDLLAAAQAGERERFARAASTCRARLGSWSFLGAELEAVLVAIDPDADVIGANPAVAAWCRGESAAVPAGLDGLGRHELLAEAGDPSVGFVVARPGRPARRVLALGALLAGEREARTAIEQARRRPGRNETAIAALALAGQAGLPKADLFRAVYGFAYSAPLHQGVLDVLLHRARAQLAAPGDLSRDEDRLRLQVRRFLLVADPRCARATDDQVLRVLAQKGAGTAKDAAQALQIPLRTAQAAIQSLVSDGVCILERHGRRVEYRVEDSTFCEPTKY